MPSFRLQVMSLKRVLFNDDVLSIYLCGDEGEYELLAFHYPLMGTLVEGEIKIAGHASLGIRSGVIMFDNNKCTILVEELDPNKPGGTLWKEIESLASLDKGRSP